MDDKIAIIETTAATVPCFCCGKRKITKTVVIKGDKVRNYEDIAFLACVDCLKKITSEIASFVKEEES